MYTPLPIINLADQVSKPPSTWQQQNRAKEKKPMASSSRARFTAWAVAAVLLPAVLVVSTGAAVSCGDAVNALIPCGSYLVGSGQAEPSPQCCKSARGLNRMATTVAERRAVCQCFKQTGPSFGVKPQRANHLVSACNLKLTIPLSPNVDCSRIS